jgi:hypothetical protein
MLAKSPRLRWNLVALSFPLLASLGSAHAAGVTAEDTKDIRALVLQKAAAETAHDIDGMDRTMAHAAPGQPDPVSYVARAYQFWGRDAVIQHFRKVFAGTWRVEPEQDAIRITPLNADAAQIYVPTRVTLGASGQPATTATFLINETAIRTPEGWRITSVIPVPAD